MYVGVFAIVNKIKSTISGLVSQNTALSDSMANIRKVSQWAAADVEQLTRNLAKIDTRNTITTLQQLAYEGAKLGIGNYGVGGLTGFVKAAEQVQTALGEDLGEEALPALAKLTEVMGLLPKYGVEQAMQKAGSAIYQLSASSTATGKNIVEFSKRLMGLANVSGITSSELLGLGSASDSMALPAEVSATAFNKLFNAIQANTAGIAKAVGLAEDELKGLIYEGKTMDAIVKVFDQMNKMSLNEMEGRGVFKALGSDGSRLVNVMVTMADKVEMLKDHLNISNKAFEEGKAVINEYMIQQETAAAYFERASNIWAKAFVNPEGVDIVKQLAQEWYNVSYEMTHSASTMASIKTTLELLAGTVRLLITWLPTLVKLMMFYGVGAALQGIIRQYQAIHTSITLAAGAQARFNALLKTNAWAIAITAVMMFAAKVYEMAQASKAAAEAEEKRRKVFSDAAAEALQNYNKQKAVLDEYEEALDKSNTSESERNEIIRKFKDEFGTYLDKLGIEIRTYDDMEAALHRVNKELKDKAYYEAADRLRPSYVGDAESEQTLAMSKYVDKSQELGLSPKLMQDILAGEVSAVEEALLRFERGQYEYPNIGRTVVTAKNQQPGTWWDLIDENRDKDKYGIFGSIGYTFNRFVADGKGFAKIYPSNMREIFSIIDDLVRTTQEVKRRGQMVDEFVQESAEGYKPGIYVEGALLGLKKLKDLSEEQLHDGLNVLRDEYNQIIDAEKKLKDSEVLTAEELKRYEDKVASRDKSQIGIAIDEYSKEIRSRRGKGYTPPPTEEELAAAEREQRKAYRDELKKAVEESNAVIAKIEEWYRLQETVVTDMLADGKLTKEQADQVIRTLNIEKNHTLGTARRAIATGGDEEWKQMNQHIGDLQLDLGQWSTDLLADILDVNLKKSHDTIARFDGSEAVLGVSSTADFDKISKNAAGNFREIARLQAKSQQEVRKILDEYNFVDVAMQAFSNRLAQMGILSETARHMAEQLARASNPDELYSERDYNAELQPNEQAKRETLQAFIKSGTRPYAVDPENLAQLREWFMAFVGEFQQREGTSPLGPDVPNVEYVYQSWAKPFEADFELWLRDSEKYKSDIQAFYLSLLQSEEQYFDARKKAYNKAKKDFDQMWEVSGRGEAFSNLDQQLALRQRQLALTGKDKGTNFADQAGFSALNEDPEIAASIARMVQKEQELEMERQVAEQKKMVGEELLAHQQLLREKEQALADASMSMQEQLMAKINERISKMQEWTQPIENFGSEVGKALYDQWHNGESITSKWQDLLKSMALSWGQTTVSIVKELMMQKLKQKLINKAMQAETAAHEATTTAIQQAGATARQTLQAATGQAQVQGQQATNTTLEVQEQAHNTEMLAEDMGHAAAENPVNLSRAAGKTLADLGWWGIPLVAVITALLNGLLQAALGTSNKNSKSNTSSTAATKTKLVSGMLTYDRGNISEVVSGSSSVRGDSIAATSSVAGRLNRPTAAGQQPFLGTDGHVYTATPEAAPKTGLITRPIATSVQGQPALVAEKGPEIVIGRAATKRIMMDEPGLLRHLAAYDRAHGPAAPYRVKNALRPFDEGTDLAQQLPTAVGMGWRTGADTQSSGIDPDTAEALRQLPQAMAAFAAVMGTIQQKGIPSFINKYGPGGLVEEVKSGLKFDARYNK